MSTIAAPLPLWSVQKIRHYRENVAPFRKNAWNTLDEWMSKKHRGTMIFAVATLCVLYIVFMAPPYTLQTTGEWISIALLFMVLGIYFIVVSIPTLAVQKPRWVTCSLVEYYEQYDIGHFPHHPLRQVIIEARNQYPEAEFKFECFVPEMEKREMLPKSVIVWMYPDPSETSKRDAVMVLENGLPMDQLTWS